MEEYGVNEPRRDEVHEGRRKKEEGRRKKEGSIKNMQSPSGRKIAFGVN
jgi:hypothetical protein